MGKFWKRTEDKSGGSMPLPSGKGGDDVIPAILSGGSYDVPASYEEAYSAEFLAALNRDYRERER